MNAKGSKPTDGLIEVGVNILHWLDNIEQTTFDLPSLREQLRTALLDNGVEPERIAPR